jgi:CheY-like chemotaxis protein
MPTVPGWVDLLADLATLTSPETNDLVNELLLGQSSRHLEIAAQALKDSLGDQFDRALAERLDAREIRDETQDRLQLLDEIPFRAVLTTNFDNLLRGRAPGPDAYLEILRPPQRPWWALENNWLLPTGNPNPDTRILKLHGSTDGVGGRVVFTMRDYRERLYKDSGYATFLKALFATNTVLYLGVSFTDAYVNELRSEILALIGHNPDSEPLAYAILPDTSRGQRRHLLEHEAIETIPYETGPNDTHNQFDSILADLHEQTNPFHRLGRLIADRRIVWLDPTPTNNLFGIELLQHAARKATESTQVIQVGSVQEATRALQIPTDLVITHWGRRSEPGSTAEDLLTAMRSQGLEAPVVVFTQHREADERKRRALQLGAAAYTFKWETLVGEIQRIFTAGSESG